MTELELHRATVLAVLALGAVTFAALWFVPAPYGRHGRRGFGREVSARAGWIAMECPAALGFAGVFAQGEHRAEMVPLVLLAAWEAHYLYRAFVYPLRLRPDSRMPLLVAGLGLGFNTVNAWINARFVSHLGTYDASWISDPRFAGGALLFVGGLWLNRRADAVLLRLRRAGDGYRIPRGGAFELVACPNYTGEIAQWLGWAAMTWSSAGLAFAAYTAANLVPRARTHLRWYRATFPEFPPRRRALIPWVW